MATIRKVDYFVLRTPHRAGEGARLLKALRQNDVNLLALTAFPGMGGAQVDFIPENPSALKALAKKQGWRISAKKTAFLVQGTDRAGALVGVLDKLGKAGINVTALNGVTAGWARFGAIFWVKPKDVTRAGRLLKAKK